MYASFRSNSSTFRTNPMRVMKIRKSSGSSAAQFTAYPSMTKPTTTVLLHKHKTVRYVLPLHASKTGDIISNVSNWLSFYFRWHWSAYDERPSSSRSAAVLVLRLAVTSASKYFPRSITNFHCRNMLLLLKPNMSPRKRKTEFYWVYRDPDTAT